MEDLFPPGGNFKEEGDRDGKSCYYTTYLHYIVHFHYVRYKIVYVFHKVKICPTVTLDSLFQNSKGMLLLCLKQSYHVGIDFCVALSITEKNANPSPKPFLPD